MIAAIYFGTSKPDIHLYFDKFIDELSDIFQNGMIVNKHKLAVSSVYFVCDSPARCHIKGKY